MKVDDLIRLCASLNISATALLCPIDPDAEIEVGPELVVTGHSLRLMLERLSALVTRRGSREAFERMVPDDVAAASRYLSIHTLRVLMFALESAIARNDEARVDWAFESLIGESQESLARYQRGRDAVAYVEGDES